MPMLAFAHLRTVRALDLSYTKLKYEQVSIFLPLLPLSDHLAAFCSKKFSLVSVTHVP